MDGIEDLLSGIQGKLVGEKVGNRRHISTDANPLLMRLRLAALLVIGHTDYPDSLSRLTNLQVSIFALFDAIKAKTDKVMLTPQIPPDPDHPKSRYYAVKKYYASTPSGEDVHRFYGLSTFSTRFKAMSQSIMGEGRKEYLSGIEEKPIQLKTGNRDDLDIPKPSLYEAITGKPKRDRRGE